MIVAVIFHSTNVLAVGCNDASSADQVSAKNQDLQLIRRNGNLAQQRLHAWEIIGGLTREQPLLERWYGEEQVFAEISEATHPSGIHGFSRAAGSDVIRPRSDSADPAIFSYTLYNEAAYLHIQCNKLNRISELERLRGMAEPDTGVPGDRSIPSFPADAIVMKTVWWPVAHDGLTPLPVWDADRNPPRKSGNDYTTWQRVVAIDPSPTGRRGGIVQVDFAAQSFPDASRVSLKDFHFVAVDRDMALRTMRDPSARKAAVIALGREVREGDYLILVGASLATREISDWIWVTFWWHDHPEQGPFAVGRPRDLIGVWRNYLMATAFDSNLPASTDGGPHICFNPWLEGRFPDGGRGGGRVSNCMACHSRASYPAIGFLPVTRGAPDLKGDPAYASGRLRTSFLWAISLHARP